MFMEEPLFNQLRTQEQLGYEVSCVVRNTYGILGYSISVYNQVDKHSTEHVDNRIDKFLKSFNDVLKLTTEKDLETVKEALTKIKQCADIHLKEEVDRNWIEITNCDYVFDRLEKEIIAIEDIKLEELKDWLAAHSNNGDNFKKLSIHVVGNKEKAQGKKKEGTFCINVYVSSHTHTLWIRKIKCLLQLYRMCVCIYIYIFLLSFPKNPP